ncbi:hypothetical protein LNQ82_04565 [Conchiformibius steedae DSM 2580]|uniref:Uncharacterized protein n=1 Tax=Conchiformibius steedae DSM 2580 TaxID=1121352 RepID=A0AAE9L0T3_9NEIS|nr:hypothetical protein [Conchiformibius steedae]QMT33763.1 hypothetical protein H3L98_01645 [Conchiformibius steedae]URD68424.1 hypothetical protein LNQ82_04565 [Conchiformibius steedae DSM 2580]
MGYQVGNTCYATKGAAENAYFSQVAPVIQQNGRLLQLQYNGNPKHIDGGWTLNGRTVSASLPQCSPAENFKDGAQIGFMFLLAAIGLWTVFNIKTILDKFS